MQIPKTLLRKINLDASKALVKMSANCISVATCSITTDWFSKSSLIKWWLTNSYVFIIWIRQKNKSKNNIINIKFNNHDTWFTLPQSKHFVKLSYHALEACFNSGLSLIFLPISVSIAEAVGTVIFCSWFSTFSVRQTTSSFLDTHLRNSLSPVKCLEQPLKK